MPRANSKAIQKDIDNTFDILKREFFAVEQRTGCKAFYFAVCGDVEHHNEPKVYMSPETEKFFKDVLNMNPGKFAMQYEAYIVGGTANLIKSGKMALSDEISKCRALIADGLAAILHKHNVPTNCKTSNKLMNYENYEKKIVEEYGVELKGWSYSQIVNPGKLRRGDLAILLGELEAGQCRWEKLSEEELRKRILSNHARHEAGEQVYKSRKTQKGRNTLGSEIEEMEDTMISY